MDRQVLGILAPTLQRELQWSERDSGAIVSWFSLSYGVGLLLTGRLLDRVGVRAGFSFAIVFWSLAAMGHALARTAAGVAALLILPTLVAPLATYTIIFVICAVVYVGALVLFHLLVPRMDPVRIDTW